jgi:hypothetical protein
MECQMVKLLSPKAQTEHCVEYVRDARNRLRAAGLPFVSEVKTWPLLCYDSSENNLQAFRTLFQRKSQSSKSSWKNSSKHPDKKKVNLNSIRKEKREHLVTF